MATLELRSADDLSYFENPFKRSVYALLWSCLGNSIDISCILIFSNFVSFIPGTYLFIFKLKEHHRKTVAI